MQGTRGDASAAMCERDYRERTAEELQLRRRVLAWARQALTTRNADLKRDPRSKGEAVCPFLRRSMQSGYCYLDFSPEIAETYESVRQLTLDARDRFEALQPREGPDLGKKSLMMVFPHGSASLPRVLDEIHASLKTDFVRSGHMLARFYQGCDVGSIWNRRLKVFDSPVPLIAIRRMAKHDVHFLSHNADWFREFDRRFGDAFRNEQATTRRERAMWAVYEAAKTRFVGA
jgi:hypothetical protein